MFWSFLFFALVLPSSFLITVSGAELNFRCTEQSYRYLSCRWDASSHISCWSLTNPIALNYSLPVCDIHRSGGSLVCNISQRFYNSLSENSFLLTNTCENVSFTQVISTETDKNVQLFPVKYIHPVWTSETEVNLTWPLPVFPCMTNDYNGGINCSLTVSITSSNVPTSSEWLLSKQVHQKKWTAISRSESNCVDLPELSLSFKSLQSSTRYKAGVRCRPFGSKYWSDLTSCYFWTNVTKPQGVPFAGPGSYVLYRCGPNNCLALYWRMTRYHDEEIRSYSLYISHKSSPAAIINNVTMATFLNLPIQPLYEVTIRAQNAAGTSAPFKVLIDTQTADVYRPQYVSAMQVKRFTYEVTFRRADLGHSFNIITYYWCRGKQRGPAVNCRGDIKWEKVPVGAVTRYLDTYRYNLTTDIQNELHFAVALVDGNKTSGMVWGETVYEIRDPTDRTAMEPVLAVVLPVTAVLLISISVTIALFLKRRNTNQYEIEMIDIPTCTTSRSYDIIDTV